MTKTLFALLVTSSSIAAAGPRVATLELHDGPPGDTAPVAEKANAKPDAYVSLGGAIGVGDGVDWMYGGASVDGGYRITDTLWVRGRFDRAGRIGYGAVNQSITIVSPEQPHSVAMLGIETRRCRTEAVCVVAGTDTGVRFGDTNFTDGVEIVGRLGLDLGTRHFRVRPGIEQSTQLMRSHHPSEPALSDVPLGFGLGFTTTIAYQW